MEAENPGPPFINSLKFKFFLLLGVFVLAIAAINIIHFASSQKVARELERVETNSLPLYAAAFNMIGAFEGTTRHFEDAVTTGEQVLLERAAGEYVRFEKYLDQLRSSGLYPFQPALAIIDSNSAVFFKMAMDFSNALLVMDPSGLEPLGNDSIIAFSREMKKLKATIQLDLNQLFDTLSEEVFGALTNARWKVSKQVNSSMLVGFIAFFVLFGFLLFLSRRIIVPIRSLSSMISRVAKGNFKDEKDVPIRNRDEVGELARSFQIMKKNLSESTVSRAFVDNIIRSMVDSLVVLDSEYRITRINRAARKLLGVSLEDLLGGNLDTFFGEDFRAWCRKESLYELREISKRERTLLTAEKKSIPVLFSCSLLLDKNSEVEGIVCLAQDITDLKRAEKELEVRASELMRSNKELEEFAYVASHDLQEPLRMVTSYLQLLQRRYGEKLGDDAREYISFAVEGSGRMKDLINDLLSYSRVGKNSGELIPVSAEKVLGDTLKLLRPALEEYGVRLTFDPLPQVLSEPTQLGQLFQNLLSNAIKYRGTATLQIHVGVERDRDYWRFAVRDNGIGMESKYLERIFVIFQRLHTKESYPGTGIGLALCKKIVERHKGSIWVDSTPNEGSTFYFTLPVTTLDARGEEELRRYEKA